MSYMYDGDDPNSPEDDTGELNQAQSIPGYIGGRLIFAPTEPFKETADDTLLRPAAHQWWDITSDPGDDFQKYSRLNGTFSDLKFMQHPFLVDQPAYDYRFFNSTGPYIDFAPGDTLRVVYVAGVGKGLQGLRQNLDNALIAYYMGSITSDPANPSHPEQDLHWEIPGVVKGTQFKVNPHFAVPGEDSVHIQAKIHPIDVSVTEARAFIKHENGTVVDSVMLYDDGAHKDGVTEDEIYANSWPIDSDKSGTFMVDVHAKISDGRQIMWQNKGLFSTLGPVNFDDINVAGQDTLLETGKPINFQIILKNNDQNSTVKDITAKTRTEDKYVENLTVNNIAFPDIPAGETASGEDYFYLQTKTMCPNDHTALIDIDIFSHGEMLWTDSFELTFTDLLPPTLYHHQVQGFVNPGEPVTIQASLQDGSGVEQVMAEIMQADTSLALIQLPENDDNHFSANWVTPEEPNEFNINLMATDSVDNETIISNLMGFTTQTFNSENNILLVDDDNYNHPRFSSSDMPYEKYFTQTLESLNNPYDVYSIYYYGVPDSNMIFNYLDGIIIWETGDTRKEIIDDPDSPTLYNEHSLSSAEIHVLQRYLELGGKLFLTGQGIGYNSENMIETLYENYLGVSIANSNIEYKKIEGFPNDPISDNIISRIRGGTGADNQVETSSFEILDDHTFPVFQYNDGQIAGVRVDTGNYRVVCLGFGFEAIYSESHRNEIMERSIDWLTSVTGIEPARTTNQPLTYALYPNYPNPFNPTTTIRYDLPKDGHVKIQIMNLLGQTVETLVDRDLKAGEHTINWNAASYSSGVYIVRYESGSYIQHRKILLLK